MANQFEVQVPNALQALLSFDQGYKSSRDILTQRQQESARMAAKDALVNGGDTRGALARLIGAGDIQGANAVATLGQQDWERNFRTQEAQRTQGNVDRSFRLQEKQAEEKPQYMQVDDGQGGKVLVQIQPYGRGVSVVNPTGLNTAPTNPYAMGKMTETQSKDALYASRMFGAEKLLRDPSVIDAATSVTQAGLNAVPGVGNFMVSESFQKYDQAKRDFINAVLRRESGAVIAESEFANAEKQYFPQPGDSKQVIEQKKRNREEAIRGIAAGAGQQYRPQNVFGANGEIIENPALKPRQQSITKEQYDALPSGTPFTAPDGSVRVKP